MDCSACFSFAASASGTVIFVPAAVVRSAAGFCVEPFWTACAACATAAFCCVAGTPLFPSREPMKLLLAARSLPSEVPERDPMLLVAVAVGVLLFSVTR